MATPPDTPVRVDHPDRSSVTTGDLSRPLSASFDGSSSRYPSGLGSTPPLERWYSLSHLAGPRWPLRTPSPHPEDPEAVPGRRDAEQSPTDYGEIGNGSPVSPARRNRDNDNNPGHGGASADVGNAEETNVAAWCASHAPPRIGSTVADVGDTAQYDLSARHVVTRPDGGEKTDEQINTGRVRRGASPLTLLYTLSHLVLFAILGTLARVGLQALTTYHGAPVLFASVWANVAGCVVMGFLVEDTVLFRPELPRATGRIDGHGVVRRAHAAAKKAVPLYVGLATGFCGSFTSFSAFMRDAYLAASGDLAAPGTEPLGHGPGRNFMSLAAVLVTTPGLSLAGFFLGTHLSAALEVVVGRRRRFGTFTPSMIVDCLSVPLALCAWAVAIVLAALSPALWPGRKVAVALAFAPLGCLLRFALSLVLNPLNPAFPLGTFVANALGTAVLGGAWDASHAVARLPRLPVGGCLALTAGLQDGFCGCLTTVSTWAAELAALRRHHAYVYGGASMVASLALLALIMGIVEADVGFVVTAC